MRSAFWFLGASSLVLGCRPPTPAGERDAAVPDGVAQAPTATDPARPLVTPLELGPFVTCTRSYGQAATEAAITSRPAAEVVTLDRLDEEARPRTRILVEGYPVDFHPCAPCPADTACKPCESYAVISSIPYAGIKQPISKELDLWIVMPDPESLLRGTKYRIALDVCESPNPIGQRAHVEWRGAVESSGSE